MPNNEPRWMQRKPSAIPEEMLAQARKMGKVVWTAEALSDAEHVEVFKTQVEKTREHFKTEGPQKMHGIQLEGSGLQLCYTGTSPNSGPNAATIVALWNWLVDQANA